MALFFTRRSYNKTKKTFTNNPANHSRYISITGDRTPNGGWMGSTIPQKLWNDQVLDQTGAGALTIFVHGYNTKQSDMLKRLSKIEAGLNRNGYNGALIAYDWPSDGSELNYKQDLRDAKATAEFLIADGVLPLLRARPKLKIHLIGHSLGAYVIIRALSRFGDSNLIADRPWGLSEIAFISADVDQARLEKGTSASLAIHHRSKRLTNYHNTLDEVLWAAWLVNDRRPRLGRAGLSRPHFANHFDVYGTEQFRTKILGTHQSDLAITHNWWFEDTGFYRDLALTLGGTKPKDMSTRRPTDRGDWALLT